MKSYKICALALLPAILTGLVSCGGSHPDKGQEEGLELSDSIVRFSDEDASKVTKKATFDVSAYTESAVGTLCPYALFSDGMCLQRECVNRIFGSSDEGKIKKIAVIFRDETYYGKVETDGSWNVYLPKMSAGGPYEMTVVCDKGRISFTNVYVGEVYLLGGQSNMEWKVYQSEEVLEELYSDREACKNDKIRMLTLPANPQKTPEKTFSSKVQWQGARSSAIRDFSAVGYLFGKTMQEELDCPVGLVNTAVSATSIEYWMSGETYASISGKAHCLSDTSVSFLTPSLGFNGSLYPLEGFRFRGAVWYQGCANAEAPVSDYDVKLEAFVAMLRNFFRNENLTFTVCELARYRYDPIAYSRINEEISAVAQKDPLVTVALNLDQGDWNDIHPKDKRAIGIRAGNETLRSFFGVAKNAAPVVTGWKRISETEAEIALSENVVLKNGSNGFEVFTDEGYTYDCTVTVRENAVTVSSAVPFTKIRYGHNFRVTEEAVADVSKSVTVFDAEGLPLDLFTLDLSG